MSPEGLKRRETSEVSDIFDEHHFVIPAKAGIHFGAAAAYANAKWIMAFAGMTRIESRSVCAARVAS
jgi:hypothetical protein